jgi:hypothetical protein
MPLEGLAVGEWHPLVGEGGRRAQHADHRRPGVVQPLALRPAGVLQAGLSGGELDLEGVLVLRPRAQAVPELDHRGPGQQQRRGEDEARGQPVERRG